MTLLQELEQIKLFLVCGADKNIMAETYAKVLGRHGILYHFDEYAKDVFYKEEEQHLAICFTLLDELTGEFIGCDVLWESLSNSK